MKKLAFVATGYIKSFDGISVYIENLLLSLIENEKVKNRDISIDIFVGDSVVSLLKHRVFEKKEINENIKIIPVSEKNLFLKSVDLQKKLLFTKKYDVTFMANVMPIFLTHGKSIKVIHDLTIKQTPELFSKFRHFYIDFLIKYMIKFDDAIGYISNTTKDDIKKFYCTYKKVSLYVPNGIPFKVQKYPTVNRLDIIKKYQMDSLEFIVVGRINRAKGFDRILSFFQYFESTLKNNQNFSKVTLHIVGKQTDETKKIFENADFNKIELIFHGFVDDKELNVLYQRSHFSFFLSRNEGYGLPLVEAIWFGVIPIVSDIDIFSEILGSDYPKFNDKMGYKETVNKFLLILYKDKEYLKFIIDKLKLILEKEKNGYKKSSDNLVTFINNL